VQRSCRATSWSLRGRRTGFGWPRWTPRRREAEAREKLRRLTDALSAGIDPAALIGPINAAQADSDAARAQLDALDAPAPVPAHELVEQALEMLGDRVEDVLSADRSPHLLREFYASIGLGLSWHHDARRLSAKLDLGPAVADLTIISKAPTNRGLDRVSEGGLFG
jgi:hypothetical protein